MFEIVIQGGRLGMLRVTLVHSPLPRFTHTRPSLVPAQSVPASFGDSAMANTTPAYSTPMLSNVRPPLGPILLRSFKVRSGLMTCQELPPSLVTCTNWLPTYTVLWSCGEIAMGNSQLKRYFTSAAVAPEQLSGHTSTSRA